MICAGIIFGSNDGKPWKFSDYILLLFAPPQPRAAQQVDEESFDRVIGVVRDRDERIAVLAAEGVEPTITEAPGRHR